MENIKPKFIIIPNKHVESYAQTINDCITGINLESNIDTRYQLKLAERMKDTEAYIVIAVGPKNVANQTLQIKLDNQIQTMSFEQFIKFTLVLTHS